MSSILGSQQHLFALDGGVTYLDNASVSPTPIEVAHSASAAAMSKSMPWLRDRENAHAQAGHLRELAAQLIGANGSDMAITCSASYGLATARDNLPVLPGERILVLEDDHSSQILTWRTHAHAAGASLDVVQRPADDDWTTAILKHLDHPDSGKIAIASLSASFWLDGCYIDLVPVCRRLRELGAAVVLDLTQSVGVMDLDVKVLDPDFVVFPMYKWLLGPYSLAFLYAAPRRQGGTPLEENVFNRRDGAYDLGALRYDMGERDVFVGIPTGVAALKLVSSWPRASIEARLRHLTNTLAAMLKDEGYTCVEQRLRSPHILGVKNVREGLAADCKPKGVYINQRHGGLRISPHVFNTEADLEVCASTLSALRRN